MGEHLIRKGKVIVMKMTILISMDKITIHENDLVDKHVSGNCMQSISMEISVQYNFMM